MRYIVIALGLLLSSCAPKDPSPVIFEQDIESCTIDSDTPWCQSACTKRTHEWCTK